MKRLHVSVSVADIESSATFYERLFGAPPSVRHSDYAKWMLDDPRVNFVIERRDRATGVDHLGIQAESADELETMAARLRDAGEVLVEQHNAQCCYARSDKAWVRDPQGLPWETFITHGQETTYGEDTLPPAKGNGPCCTPGGAAR